MPLPNSAPSALSLDVHPLASVWNSAGKKASTPLLTFCLVLQLGGARALDTGGEVGDRAGQILLLLTFVVGLVVLVQSRAATIVYRASWPILFLPLLAIISSVWSIWPYLTLKMGVTYWLTTLSALALAVTAPPPVALGALVRAMGYTCILSAAVAVFIPSVGVHQADDAIQAVHAGLWRGILGHKVGLGLFSGVTLPLLLAFRRESFSFPFWLLAVACTTACLINADSTTGKLAAVFLLFLLLSFRIEKLVKLVLGMTIVFLFLVLSDLLNILVPILGKSSDLTGRAEVWPLVKWATTSTPVGALIGHGYVAGFKMLVGPMIEPFLDETPSDSHNGFLELMVYFGYLGSTLVYAAHFWLFRRSYALLTLPNVTSRALLTVPMSLLLVAVFINYSEAHFMIIGSVFTQITMMIAVWAAAPQPARELSSDLEVGRAVPAE
jgi:exopolysaccharide production protein ExoQ